MNDARSETHIKVKATSTGRGQVGQSVRQKRVMIGRATYAECKPGRKAA